MTSKERMKKALGLEEADRVPMADAPWPEAEEAWHAQGMPAGVWANEFFDMDIIVGWMIDTTFRFEPKLLESTEEYNIVAEASGVKSKYYKTRSIPPEPLEWPVKTRSDWDRLKGRLGASAERLSLHRMGAYCTGGFAQPKENVEELYKKYKDSKFVTLHLCEPYEATWPLVGQERMLMLMVEDPAWVREMFDAAAELAAQMIELTVGGERVIDGLFVGGDIAYKNGMLFSPRMYRDLLMPGHMRIFEAARKAKLPIIYHSDGNVREALPLLIEAGITAIQPLEVNAGNDVREFKREFGKDVAFMGNIGVGAMSAGKKEIEEEVRSKVTVAKKGGGYVYWSDHSVPPSVSFENYKYVIEMVQKYGAY